MTVNNGTGQNRKSKTIKKYSNRRLYDTNDSGYITLEELANTIREGWDVRVVDASSGEDLTQATLAQIVVESRGAAKLLPVPLLLQMIRMGDDALTEFMSLYMTWALEVYTQMRRGMSGISGYSPFQNMGFSPGQALNRLFSFGAPWAQQQQQQQGGFAPPPTPQAHQQHQPPHDPAPQQAASATEPTETGDAQPNDDVAALRREMDELKDMLRVMTQGRKDE